MYVDIDLILTTRLIVFKFNGLKWTKIYIPVSENTHVKLYPNKLQSFFKKLIPINVSNI